MAEALVPDAMWEFVRQDLPAESRPGHRGGRPAIDNRRTLAGIMFVLKYGVPWQAIPAELGCGSGSTCWRRFRQWTEAGVWQKIHARLIEAMVERHVIDSCLLIIDSASVRALLGGSTPGPTRPIGAKTAANAT